MAARSKASKVQDLPEVFRPQDAKQASRAAAGGEIRRLARALYTTNLDEPAERLIARRWAQVAAIYFPGAVIVDRSAVLAGPAADGSLFLDVGSSPKNPRPVKLPGLTLRPRNGPGPIPGDMPFVSLHSSSPARTLLDNLAPSRTRSGTRRTLTREELETWLEDQASTKGETVLNQLRDDARRIAPELGAQERLADADRLIGAMLGSRDAELATPRAKSRAAGMGYDRKRLELFESLRRLLASSSLAERPEVPDPQRLMAFYEAYFSNWIEGTQFGVDEAKEIIFEGSVQPSRPADSHDILGTFEAIIDPSLSATPPSDFAELEEYLRSAHRLIMRGRREIGPGEYKTAVNRAGSTTFVRSELVRGTLKEGFEVLATLPAGLPRAVFAMFLVSEVHPFADGNGRTARLLMNAELNSQGLARILIPIVYRDEYLTALKALSQGSNLRPLSRVLDRAQEWSAGMAWHDEASLDSQLAATNALLTPEAADESGRRLVQP